MKSIPDYFGSMVFDDRVMKAMLSADTYRSLKKTIKEGASLDLSVANAVAFAMKDWGLFGSEYDLTLNDGTTISFDSNKTWDKVNSPVAPVPASLVPAPITTYLNTNFAGVALMKIEKERYGYEVKLANGLEMKFNQQGALREIDD